MHYSHLESVLQLIDESSQKKYYDLQVTFQNIANDVFLQNLDQLNSEIMKIDKEILKYTIRMTQKAQIVQYTDNISDNITVSENRDENFNLETQQKFKNKSTNDLLFSQKLKEEKSGGTNINEITELEQENSSLGWEYVDINNKNMDLQAINNFKFSADHLYFDNIKEISASLN